MKKKRKKAKKGKSMLKLAIWNNILTFLMPTCPLHSLSFNMSQQKPPHPLFTIFFHLLFALPQTLYYSDHATEQSDFNTFSRKMNWTLIVRCENSVKIWRENVRLYSWRGNKHGWLSHWQQRLLGALAAVDKVDWLSVGPQSGAVSLALCLHGYIILCWAHHGNIETGNRITCWFKRGQWPSDFWSGNLYLQCLLPQ